MKTYKDALFDVHKELIKNIELKIETKDNEYLEGLLEAGEIVLAMIAKEDRKKGENND